MTEQEWLATSDPRAMVEAVRDNAPPEVAARRGWAWNPSDRKLRLFACTCARHGWHQLHDVRSRRGVEIAERFADGEATPEELAGARSKASSARAWRSKPKHYPQWLAHVCTAISTDSILAVFHRQMEMPHLVPPQTQAHLLRDIVGNPFRPVTLAACNCGSCVAPGRQHHNGPCAVRRLRTPTVVSLAQAAYEDRDEATGHLDPLRLAILADALEEAGCKRELCQECGGSRRIWVDYPPVEPHWNGCHDCDCGLDPQSFLGHLRSPGPHVRGCWAVDLILGKE